MKFSLQAIINSLAILPNNDKRVSLPFMIDLAVS